MVACQDKSSAVDDLFQLARDMARKFFDEDQLTALTEMQKSLLRMGRSPVPA